MVAYAARFWEDVRTLTALSEEGQLEQPAEHLGSQDRWLLVAVCLAPFVTQLATFALSPFLPFIA